jgi:hypothetical protein
MIKWLNSSTEESDAADDIDCNTPSEDDDINNDISYDDSN